MLIPLQTLPGVRHDDLTKMLTLISTKLPANQIFGSAKSVSPVTTKIEFTVFFDGLIKHEDIVAKTISQLLAKEQYRANYSFDIKAVARKAIVSPKGAGPYGFRDRLWDKNCLLFGPDPVPKNQAQRKKQPKNGQKEKDK